MCGRYSQVYSLKQAEQALRMPLHADTPLPVNYNVAPTQPALVVLNNAPEQLQQLRWGLIPYWSKDPNPSTGARLINARRESIGTKPSFRIPVRQRRCLVLADSFYEWRRSGKQKLPYRILRKNDELLVMAGIWDSVQMETGETLSTFSIITTDPNAEMESIHNRMPVLLHEPEQQSTWLGDAPLEDALMLLQTPPDDTLKYYRVGQAVNNVRNDGPALHHVVTDDPLTLF